MVVPLVSKKNAPVVSPAHAQPRVSWIEPATCSPPSYTYCCGERIGQYPPPMVEEFVESTQISPAAESPQYTRLIVRAPKARAKSRNPALAAGAPFCARAGAASRRSAATAPATL